MTAPLAAFDGSGNPAPVRRTRLVRERSVSELFGLHPGEMYRIAYSVGGSQQRRVTRSIAVFTGQAERRRWGGEMATCLDFALPQGRVLSLLSSQLVDARPAAMNERGQWVLMDQQQGTRRRRAARRSSRQRGA